METGNHAKWTEQVRDMTIPTLEEHIRDLDARLDILEEQLSAMEEKNMEMTDEYIDLDSSHTYLENERNFKLEILEERRKDANN
jgi:hypothetical protein